MPKLEFSNTALPALIYENLDSTRPGLTRPDPRVNPTRADISDVSINSTRRIKLGTFDHDIYLVG